MPLLTLRGGYARLYAPLSGRDLDFSNRASLGGQQYLWNGSGAGQLVAVFGGPYSPSIRTFAAPMRTSSTPAWMPRCRARSPPALRVFRRDEKRRIAAIDTGVPAADYMPVAVTDPGPDGIAGTFDDQKLTVFAQNSGQPRSNRYLLDESHRPAHAR